jgi:hypothetical protein
MDSGSQEQHPQTEVLLARLDEQVKSLSAAFNAERTASKEAIAAAFKAAETATAAALQAQKEAAGKSEENAQAQLEMHNGLIRKMDNLVGNFPTKDGLNTELSSRDHRITALEKAVARAQGMAAAAAGVAIAVAVKLLAGG